MSKAVLGDRLKKAGAITNFTPEMINEIKKCKFDPLYFGENYFYIVHPIKGKMLMKFYESQKRLVKTFNENRFSVCLSSRQSGKCVSDTTKIKIKHKKTGKIKEISIGNFYLMQKYKSLLIDKMVKTIYNLNFHISIYIQNKLRSIYGKFKK